VSVENGAPVAGYEMHIGVTIGPGCARPFLRLKGRDEGAISEDGLVAGTYLHGLFASDPFRATFLASLRPARRGALAYEALVERILDGLAEHLERHLPLDLLLDIARRR
jgi:adenosylcobyric acid synthase